MFIANQSAKNILLIGSTIIMLFTRKPCYLHVNQIWWPYCMYTISNIGMWVDDWFYLFTNLTEVHNSPSYSPKQFGRTPFVSLLRKLNTGTNPPHQLSFCTNKIENTFQIVNWLKVWTSSSQHFTRWFGDQSGPLRPVQTNELIS